jgi:sortase A
MKSILRWTGQGLLAAGVLLLSFAAASLVYSHGFQAYQNWLFDRPRQESRQRVPIAEPIAHSVIGRLEIPRLEVSVMVVEGVADPDLLRGAGHVPGTALPGQGGNIAIAAHRDTFFRPLQYIRENDVIFLTSDTGAHQYVVTSISVAPPSAIYVLEPTTEPTLTLISCYPFTFVGPAPDRFIVRARRTESITKPPA